MAMKMSSSSAALLLFLNLLCFSLVTSSQVDCNYCGGGTKSPPPPPPPKVTPGIPCPPPPPKSTPSIPSSCPRDTLKLGVCADLLKSLLHVVVGTPPTSPCCSLIQGLADTEAAVCLCTAIKANVLGTNLDIPVSLSLLLNACGKKVPSGFQCA